MARTENNSFGSQQNQESKTKSTRVNVDSILIEELGQFGKFHIRTVLLLSLAGCLGAWATNEYVFPTARIPSSVTSTCQSSPSAWLLNAIPGVSLDSFDSCQRFANATAAPAHGEDVYPAAWFDRGQVEKCDRHLYYNTDTIVYDFDLGCDEWRRSLVGSLVVAGLMVAMPITGFVSDRWGRRTALVFNATNTAWIGLLRYFCNSYIMFVMLEFAQNVFGAGAFSTAYIMALEVSGPKYRVAAGICCSTFFASGLVILGLIAWAVPNWRILTLILFIPQLLIVSYLWIITESSRWYISKGRYEESEEVLKTIAKVNKTQLSEKSLNALRENAEEAKRNQAELKRQNKTERWLIVIVFRHKRILLRCMIVPIWWISALFVYYGLIINAVNISGNKYLNYMAVAAAQIPGFLAVLLLLDRIGRRPLLCGGFFICAACQIAYIFMPTDHYALSLTVYLVGTGCISATMTSINIYTAELFPTQYRHSLFAFCSMLGRMGSILAPLTPALGAAVWDNLPFALFAGCACAAGALVLLTPETRGVGFTDTMEEAEKIGKSKV
ncbi:hypothetical protein ABMA27_002905 [Loxostege sticticalis]|uniref:Major facilitator superfamily (MFS) profile domain-containing protein n=1 Tax=Loxostege sticticalis TaxID=481309 RepID=A0ABR3HVB5_LOXSC